MSGIVELKFPLVILVILVYCSIGQGVPNKVAGGVLYDTGVATASGSTKC